MRFRRPKAHGDRPQNWRSALRPVKKETAFSGRLEIKLRMRFTIAFLSCLLPALATAQIRTIYVIPSSHWDRGFIASPKAVVALVKPHLDEVIDDAAADPHFRWTIESIWQLDAWLERTHDPKRIALLRKLIQEGQIELSGVYGSMHTEFMGAEELNLLTQDGFRMARRLGVASPDLAMMDDVPGFTRWLPQVLAGSRIRYFLNGSNLFIGGGTSLAPRSVPFYWEAPDGSKVLTWISEGKNGGYTEGMTDYYIAPATRNPYPPHGLLIPKQLWGKPPLGVMQIGIKKLLERYENAGYKYDAVLVMYMHDFISPAAEENDLLPAVREWNASGRMPEIRVATPKEFFDHILAKYRDQIPAYHGDWTGLWAEVKTNSPGASAIAREDQMDLRANGLLWGALTLEGDGPFPSGNLYRDYRRVWNYDEHNGAGGTGWPGIITMREINAENEQYVDYVRHAEDDQAFLLQVGIGKEADRLCRTASLRSSQLGPLLAVYRPQSWPATAVVRVPVFPDLGRVRALRDLSSGKTYEVQWARSGGILVAPLLADGVALFRPIRPATSISPSGEAAPQPAARREVQGTLAVENRYYRLELRASDGAIARLTDRESGREIVNTAAGDSFNELIRAIGMKRPAATAGSVDFRIARGPVFDSIEVRRPGSYEPVTEYRLYHVVKRLEIRNLLDSERMPVVTDARKTNTFQFAFPVLPGSPIKSFHYESGFGMTAFPQDYLPGARLDAVVSHGLVFSAGDFHLAIASPQAFYWEVPSARRHPWRLWQNEVLSSVWRRNNSGITRDYGYTIFPTVEPGLPGRQWFVYQLTSWTGPWAGSLAYHKIWDAVMEPVTEIEQRLPPSSIEGGVEPLFRTDQPDVVVVAAESSLTRPGALVLRLQNLSGKARRTNVTLPVAGLDACEIDLTETETGAGRLPVKGNQVEVEVGSHATVSILLSHTTEVEQK
jgi:hypothetical protein